MVLLLGLVASVVMILGIRISARRFEAAQRKAGRWDSHGPLVETERPSYRYRNIGMEERREVVGDWTPPIVRDRRHGASRRPPQRSDQPEEESD